MKSLRTKRVLTSACIAAAAAFVTPAMAQDLLVLNPIWRVTVNNSDSMSTPLLAEMLAYQSDGSLFYVPQSLRRDTIPLYRLSNGADHMDSIQAGESGYGTEGIMGFPFTTPTAAQGIVGMFRGLNGSGDRMLLKKDETRSGYTSSALGIYGYPRYGHLGEGMNAITGGGITASSNTVAGGAVWSWVYNGTEFIDTQNFGRSIQTAMFWTGPVDGKLYNPNEAGDRHSTIATPAALRHGSPILFNHNLGLKQVTRSIPLEFSPGTFGGGSNNPVIYKDMVLGKDLTMNYNNMGAVVQYETVMYSETNIASVRIEAPTGYLKPIFNTFFTMDVVSRERTLVTPQNCPVDYTQPGSYVSFTPASGYGGIIITNAARDIAMGVYGRLERVGGTITNFTLFDFIGNCGDTVKWGAVYTGNVFGGENRFKTYIINGTIEEVTAKMYQLHADGAL